ncbi:hypothetical protein M413DRAFT_285430 [Hebeloma cylindrosporum]|uniref:Uncharacterized protein n=1 Tax=Hebeloma cylindrosporum TaxID=76867 RepID=A0A0C2XG01_HEBCY|nr:hypothetical protein M413DRAFT_285430 [Hebeloma cylindrosporum h7]
MLFDYHARVLFFLSLALASVVAQTHGVGTLFIFTPGLGACGFANTSAQTVASVSKPVFTGYPGATSNPNKNPICTHRLLIKSGLKNLTVPIVDFFVDTDVNKVGVSLPGFLHFGTEDDGVIPNVTWSVV